ncbi:MAG: Uma2 family endonuclease [Saprospiraceae bacterium]
MNIGTSSPTLAVSERLYNIAEYLDMEDKAETRHEFNNGTIIEMAGGNLSHNLIKGRIYSLLDQKLDAPKFPHAVLNSDTKVRLERENRFAYPDVTVSDGTPEYYETPHGKTRRDAIINPLLIIEVLSDDTRAYDKGEKFESYSAIPGFREYVLIEPETVWVKVQYLKDPAQNLWQIETLTHPDATLQLRSLNLSLSVADIYAALEKLPK